MPQRAVPGLPPLLPLPKHARRVPGAFALRDGLPIVLGARASDADFAAARALASALAERRGLRLPIESHAQRDGLGPHLSLRSDGPAGEAYRLKVGRRGVEIAGAGPAGLRYGVETLVQLLPARGPLPACEVEDAPDLPLRGMLLDVSRGKVPTPESLRQVVDLCVRLKLNVLMLYTEHTFRFRRHPAIGRGADPLDAETLRGLDAYAAERHVDLVPTLQSLGHMRHVLEHRRYRGLAETGRLWTLAPSEPGTLALLRDLYSEYLPNFRSRLFNANCDEPWDLGRGRSAELHETLGPGGLYLEHVRHVRDLARELGKRTLIWADVVHAHPERIAELDRDLVLLDWWYEAELDYERVKVFADASLDFLVCPGTSSWNCLFPRVPNSLLNIQRYAAAGRRHGALGLVVTDWGDGGHYNLQGNSWFGFAYAAQQAWSGDLPEPAFDRGFSRLLFRDPSGEAARLYRALGEVHEAGFATFNGSPLQYLFFDDVGSARFLVGARRAPLRRSLARLERVHARLAAARDRFGDDALTWNELRYATDASLLAVRKGLAGIDWLDWRREPACLDARARRRLARTLRGLADEQVGLGRRLRALWLARARPSNFAWTRERLAGSVRSQRAAARALERGRPPPSAPPERYDFGTALAAVARHL